MRTNEIRETFGHQCEWPTLESMEETARAARRAVRTARNATEDFVAGTTLEVRRHPLMAVAVAATAGLMTGVAVGVAGVWLWRRRSM
jgi:ElaB/YqjD/DUF883 family membrane-anchored ribosome-binding protein